MGMGQTCGMAAAMAGKGAVQDVDVSRIQEIYATDPCLDGREPDTLIDEDSELIEGKDGWKVVNGNGSYGKTYLLFEGEPSDNSLYYRIPDNLDGNYSVYAFQQNDGCENTVFEIEYSDQKVKVPFNRGNLGVEGQTRGEWVSLGSVSLKKGTGGKVRVLSEESGIHADAILFVKE